MQGCKIYKLCIVADLIEMCFRIVKIVDGQAKLLASVSVAMPPAGRKGTFDRAQPVISAFTLLSQKVTKAVPIGTKYNR